MLIPIAQTGLNWQGLNSLCDQLKIERITRKLDEQKIPLTDPSAPIAGLNFVDSVSQNLGCYNPTWDAIFLSFIYVVQSPVAIVELLGYVSVTLIHEHTRGWFFLLTGNISQWKNVIDNSELPIHNELLNYFRRSNLITVMRE